MTVRARPAPVAVGEATTDSRAVILDAAERLMLDQGYDKTSIAQLCREAGLPVGSIYHHFANKAAILAAVVERGYAQFFGGLPLYHRGSGDPDDQLLRYWRAATELAVEHTGWFVLENELHVLSRREPALRRVGVQQESFALAHLEATLGAFALEKGAVDHAGLARRTAVLAQGATRGLVAGSGGDAEELRRGMADLHFAVWSTITLAAR